MSELKGRMYHGFAGLLIGASVLLAGGCGQNPAEKPLDFGSETEGMGEDGESDSGLGDRSVVLANVVQLIGLAATNPGGANFTMAAESLNDYFEGTRPEQFQLPPRLAAFLSTQRLPVDALQRLQNKQFNGQTDGRHLEDCLLLKSVASAILSRSKGVDSDLAKVERLFDWVVRNIQLVPPGTLAAPGLRTPEGLPLQAQARPYDVLVRGLATEIEGSWAERSWLFLALCRQAGFDAGLLVVRPPQPPLVVVQPAAEQAPPLEPKTLAVGVLIDGEVYLFDARHGFPIPGPGGAGVATLKQAASQPEILGRLDLSDLKYPVTTSDLADGKIVVFLDATIGSMAQRMRLLQDQLTGERRMVVYTDPTETAEHFAQAIGPMLDSVRLWDLPLEVEFRLFNDADFNRATGFAVQLFDPRWPLLRARLRQLRGELDGEEGAIKAFVAFRFQEAGLEADGRTPIPIPIQAALNVYATYFLALAQRDLGRADEAAFLFKETLRIVPQPGVGRPYYAMFRWGAHRNLGRMLEEAGETELARRYLCSENPTGEAVGNRLRARRLIWEQPFAPTVELPVPPSAPPYYPPEMPRPPASPRAGA